MTNNSVSSSASTIDPAFTIVNKAISNIKNNNNLLKRDTDETLKQELSLLYIFYLLRYNDPSNSLYDKIKTYLSLKKQKNINPNSMSKNDTSLMNISKKKIKENLFISKKKYTDNNLKNIEEIIYGDSTFINNLKDYILSNNLRIFIKNFLDTSNLIYRTNSKHSPLIRLYETKYYYNFNRNDGKYTVNDPIFLQDDKGGFLSKRIKVFKEKNVLKYIVIDDKIVSDIDVLKNIYSNMIGDPLIYIRKYLLSINKKTKIQSSSVPNVPSQKNAKISSSTSQTNNPELTSSSTSQTQKNAKILSSTSQKISNVQDNVLSQNSNQKDQDQIVLNRVNNNENIQQYMLFLKFLENHLEYTNVVNNSNKKDIYIKIINDIIGKIENDISNTLLNAIKPIIDRCMYQLNEIIFYILCMSNRIKILETIDSLINNIKNNNDRQICEYLETIQELIMYVGYKNQLKFYEYSNKMKILKNNEVLSLLQNISSEATENYQREQNEILQSERVKEKIENVQLDQNMDSQRVIQELLQSLKPPADEPPTSIIGKIYNSIKDSEQQIEQLTGNIREDIKNMKLDELTKDFQKEEKEKLVKLLSKGAREYNTLLILEELEKLEYGLSKDEHKNIVKGIKNKIVESIPEYVFRYVDGGWYWIECGNDNKLQIEQNGKNYIYRYNCRLSLWGWFCSDDQSSLRVKKVKGSLDLLPKESTHVYTIKKKGITDDERKLIVLATLNEGMIKNINTYDGLKNISYDIMDSIFLEKCNISQYSNITQDVIEYIRLKNPKNCMI